MAREAAPLVEIIDEISALVETHSLQVIYTKELDLADMAPRNDLSLWNSTSNGALHLRKHAGNGVTDEEESIVPAPDSRHMCLTQV